MTLPTSPTNNQGPWYQSDAPVNTDPAQPPGPEQAVPNSPQGSSDTANDFTGGFNYTNGVSSTSELLKSVLAVESSQQGTAALTSAPVIAGCPSVQVNNWTGGSVGVTGSKFS